MSFGALSIYAGLYLEGEGLLVPKSFSEGEGVGGRCHKVQKISIIKVMRGALNKLTGRVKTVTS